MCLDPLVVHPITSLIPDRVYKVLWDDRVMACPLFYGVSYEEPGLTLTV
jgi:hypothetical protein